MDYYKVSREEGRGQQEKEGSQGKKKERRGRGVASRCGSKRGSSRPLERAGGGELGNLQASTQLLTVQRKKTRRFCKKPLILEGFLEKTKQHPFSLFGDSNYSEVFKINMDFLT
jgi:hypothetical protein